MMNLQLEVLYISSSETIWVAHGLCNIHILMSGSSDGGFPCQIFPDVGCLYLPLFYSSRIRNELFFVRLPSDGLLWGVFCNASPLLTCLGTSNFKLYSRRRSYLWLVGKSGSLFLHRSGGIFLLVLALVLPIACLLSYFLSGDVNVSLITPMFFSSLVSKRSKYF